ncbi:hypothetical protein CC78DRAFT_540003 [Lojkania enalia]|uniref:Mid2 domain-containing protein n=1 Tax=Lojkania enalia TaxID=147567 RepID=A0A9P4NA78_9PLEO|nr:hypothetical protein CC78DRAFT_540003 [Didymosphaeria enalia]
MLEVLIASLICSLAQASVLSVPDPTITKAPLFPRKDAIYGCGTYASTCSYNLLYTSVGASDPLTGYWCDQATYTGVAIFQTTPSGDSPNTPVNTPISTPISVTGPTPSPTSPPSDTNKTKNIGIIVGGVVGGIALIGCIVIAVVLLLRRNKKSSQPPPAPPHDPMMVQQAPTAYTHVPQKPQPNSTTVPYNPHMSVYYPPGVETSPGMPQAQVHVPNYGYPQGGNINELPSGRM